MRLRPRTKLVSRANDVYFYQTNQLDIVRLRSIDKTEDINLGEDKKEESEKTKEEKKKKPDVKRVFKMNKPEW